MEHAYHDPVTGLVGATDVAEPYGGARAWRRIALPRPPARPRHHEAAVPSPVVVSLSWQNHARSWTIDPVLLVILGVEAGLIGLGLFGKLLYAFLMWAL